MLEENLKKLGLTRNQTRIYLVLLRLGKVRAGGLIQETGLQRSVVYGALEELTGRELVGRSVSKGVALYHISDPRVLVDEAEQRKLLAEKVADELKDRQQVKEREVVVYEGDDIIKRICDKNLDAASGSEVYFLGPSKSGIQGTLEKYWKQYHKLRIEKNIRCKILYGHNTPPHILENRNTMPLCEAKYLPLQTEMPMWFNVSGDSVGIVVPSENPPLAFLIKSAKTAEALKKYFDYLWAQSPVSAAPSTQSGGSPTPSAV